MHKNAAVQYVNSSVLTHKVRQNMYKYTRMHMPQHSPPLRRMLQYSSPLGRTSLPG